MVYLIGEVRYILESVSNTLDQPECLFKEITPGNFKLEKVFKEHQDAIDYIEALRFETKGGKV